jgi:hypothetical protein
MINNIFMQGIETTTKEQQNLTGQTPLQMKTTTYNDKAAPWSRSNHALGARVLPSSDDSDKNFSGTLCKKNDLFYQSIYHPLTLLKNS